MALSVGEIEGVLRMRDEMSATVSRATASVGGLTSMMRSAVSTMVGFAGANMIMQGLHQGFSLVQNSIFGMNATLESSELQFASLMGSTDQAREHVAMLFEFAKKTPFETGPILQASRMLQVFGGAALNTQEMLRLVGDTAANVQQPINELSFWVGRMYSAIKGGQPFGEAAMRLQEMAALTPQARRQMEAMQDTGAKSDAIFKVFTESLGKHSGAMERMAFTWQGVTSTLSDTIQILGARAFRPLFETLRDGIRHLNDVLGSDRFAATADRLARAVGDTLQRAIRGVVQTFNDLRPTMQTAFAILQTSVGTISQVVKWFAELPAPVQQASMMTLAFGYALSLLIGFLRSAIAAMLAWRGALIMTSAWVAGLGSSIPILTLRVYALDVAAKISAASMGGIFLTSLKASAAALWPVALAAGAVTAAFYAAKATGIHDWFERLALRIKGVPPELIELTIRSRQAAEAAQQQSGIAQQQADIEKIVKDQMDAVNKAIGAHKDALDDLSVPSKEAIKQAKEHAQAVQKLREAFTGLAEMEEGRRVLEALPGLHKLSRDQLQGVVEKLGESIQAHARAGREIPEHLRAQYLEAVRLLDAFKGHVAVVEINRAARETDAKSFDQWLARYIGGLTEINEASKRAAAEMLRTEGDSLAIRLKIVAMEFAQKREAIASGDLFRREKLAQIAAEEARVAAGTVLAWVNANEEIAESQNMLVRSFSRTLSQIPAIVQSALTGGGGMAGAFKAIFSSLGSGLGGDLLTKGFSGIFNKAVPGLSNIIGMGATTALGMAIPGIGQALGALVGPLMGKIGGFFKGLFGGGERKEVEKMRNDFLRGAGGLEELRRRADEAGLSLDRLMSARKKKDFEAAVTDLNKKLEEHKRQMEETRAAIDKYGISIDQISPKMREAFQRERVQGLQKDIEALTRAGLSTQDAMRAVVGHLDQATLKMLGLADESAVDFKRMEETAKKYGIEIDALGPRFRAAKLTETANQIIADFKMLTAGGADVNAVLDGMKDEVQAVVLEALRFGTEVPAGMKPMIESLIEQGKLVDANGKALTDVSGINFAEPISKGIDRIVEALYKLMEGLGIKLPDAVGAAVEVSVDGFRKMKEGIDATGRAAEDAARAFRGMHPEEFSFTGGEPSVGFQTGTPGVMDFGSGMNVRLHGREAVIPEGRLTMGGGELYRELKGMRGDFALLPQILAIAFRDAIRLATR